MLFREFALKTQIHWAKTGTPSGDHLRVTVTYFSMQQKVGHSQLLAVKDMVSTFCGSKIFLDTKMYVAFPEDFLFY